MWEAQPQQQNQVYDHERVGYYADSRGGNGFLTYSENDTVSNIASRISAAGGAFQDAQVKGFIEQQRNPEYTGAATQAAGAGVPVKVLGNDAAEIWVLYIDANGNVARGVGNFIQS